MIFFYKIRKFLVCFCLTMHTKKSLVSISKKEQQIKFKMEGWRKAPWKPSDKIKEYHGWKIFNIIWKVLQKSFLFIVSIIYKFGLSVCLSVCLYSINVKTAEPIGPKIFVGSSVTPGKVYE